MGTLVCAPLACFYSECPNTCLAMSPAHRPLSVSYHYQVNMAAVGQLTQLTSLALSWLDENRQPFNVGSLSAIVGLQSLSLCSTHLTGLPLVAQACSNLTRLNFDSVGVQTLPQPHHPLAPGPPLES